MNSFIFCFQIPGNVECFPRNVLYSSKQHLFLVVFELNGVTNEVVVYQEQTDFQPAANKGSTVKGFYIFLDINFLVHNFLYLNLSYHQFFCCVGRDAAFIGPNENQYAILDDDKTSLSLYILPGATSQEVNENNGALDTNTFADANAVSDRGPLQFFFETEVDRIFTSPLGELSKISLIYIIAK